MSQRTTKKLQVLNRRKQVAELHLQGFTQLQIAEQLTISQTTISLDLKAIEKEWRDSMVRDFDLCRERELQKLAMVEREAWRAWERSQKPAQSAELPGDETVRPAKKRIRNQYGDPRFLAIVNNCSASRRALLSLDLAPQSLESPDEHIPLETRRERLVAIFDSLRDRQRTAGVGANPGDDQPGRLCLPGESG